MSKNWTIAFPLYFLRDGESDNFTTMPLTQAKNIHLGEGADQVVRFVGSYEAAEQLALAYEINDASIDRVDNQDELDDLLVEVFDAGIRFYRIQFGETNCRVVSMGERPEGSQAKQAAAT